jgi:signal transduction histidine kinase
MGGSKPRPLRADLPRSVAGSPSRDPEARRGAGSLLDFRDRAVPTRLLPIVHANHSTSPSEPRGAPRPGAETARTTGPTSGPGSGRSSTSDGGFRSLVRRVLHLANTSVQVAEFVHEVGVLWLEASGADAVEFRLAPAAGRLRLHTFRGEDGEPHTELLSPASDDSASRHMPARTPVPDHGVSDSAVSLLGELALSAGGRKLGLVLLFGRRAPFNGDESEFHRAVADTVALALVNLRVQWALRERVKELTCLYGISRLTEREEVPLGDLLARVVGLIPPGWQYPDVTEARITVDDRAFATAGFREGGQVQSASIEAGGVRRGSVEVLYTREMPELDEGPFLREERHLIDAIATGVAVLLEQRRAAEEKQVLEDQLRHADRLATIGQLAAGVAHELNEPLGAILGFGQLARQAAGLPDQAMQDIDKVLGAALHAREVVRKLMLFARQTPPRNSLVSLNELAEEGLYFVESRCACGGVQLVRELDPDLPRVTADRGQMQQVLVNLAVNAVQAMPEGGTLVIRTRYDATSIILEVVDTGTGMDGQVQGQIFVPFFTTKDVGQGTGLGLSVVHGIVAAHGGSIVVASRPGEGARFTVRLPRSGPADGGEES